MIAVVVGRALMVRQVGYRSYGLRENALVRSSLRWRCEEVSGGVERGGRR